MLLWFQAQLISIDCLLLMEDVPPTAQVARINSGAFFKSQLEEEVFC